MDGQQPTPQGSDEPSWQFKPGETISPRATQPAASPEAAPAAASQPPVTVAAPQTPVLPAAPAPPQPVPEQAPQLTPASPPQPQIQEPEAPVAPPNSITPAAAGGQVVDWTASEFIAHNKSGGWHALLLLAAFAAAVIAWVMTRDLFTTAVILIAGFMLNYLAGRQPRQVQYRVSDQGITIGQHHYDFAQFKSFSVLPEGAFASIMFVPVKRFAPAITMYYDPADEDKILDVIGVHLPHKEGGNDAVDNLMRRIRF